MDSAGKTIRLGDGRITHALEDAGFSEVKEKIIQCHVGHGSGDDTSEDASRWFQLVLPLTLDAISFLPLYMNREGRGKDKFRAVTHLCERAKKELRRPGKGLYMNL
jgi:hypothetical protein